MFFANEQRDKVREDNPGIKFGMYSLTVSCSDKIQAFVIHLQQHNTNIFTGEVGKMLGEKWKALNDKQKEPYEAKAKADKQRYEEEKAAYTAVSLAGLSHATLAHTNNPPRAASTTMRTRTKRDAPRLR